VLTKTKVKECRNVNTRVYVRSRKGVRKENEGRDRHTNPRTKKRKAEKTGRGVRLKDVKSVR